MNNADIVLIIYMALRNINANVSANTTSYHCYYECRTSLVDLSPVVREPDKRAMRNRGKRYDIARE